MKYVKFIIGCLLLVIGFLIGDSYGTIKERNKIKEMSCTEFIQKKGISAEGCITEIALKEQEVLKKQQQEQIDKLKKDQKKGLNKISSFF